MKTSLKRLPLQIYFNWFPAYRRGGGRVSYISDDIHHVVVTLKLNWSTRNIVGTLFGGSIYAAVDPIYMVMFMKILGPAYIVWDKSATIDFIKPVRGTVFATFTISKEEVQAIKEALQEEYSLTRTYTVWVQDKAQTDYAFIEKKLYFRRA